MAYRKLKSIVAPVPTEDGGLVRNRRYHKSATIDINIETTGDLRMFILVPAFMGAAVGSWEESSVKLGKVSEKKGGEERWALFSRDPNQLERGWSSLVDHYRRSMDTDTVVPMIIINKPERGYHHSSSENSAEIRVDFDRYLRNTKEESEGGLSSYGRASSINDYDWSDDLQPKSRRQRWGRNDREIEVPYTEELWTRLCQLRDQVRAANKRYAQMVESGELVKRLLAGNMTNLLGHDGSK